MSEENNELSHLKSSTKQSKIVRYGVEKDCIALRAEKGLSYQRIADLLNESGKIPEDDRLDKHVVMRYLEKVPMLDKQLTAVGQKKFAEIVVSDFDIIFETTNLFFKTKNLLEAMEDDAILKGKFMNPYQFKAVASEMRELINSLANIQKEVSDYNNIRKFMDIVMEALQEFAPDAIPHIVEKLKIVQGTKWFSEMMNRKDVGRDEK